MDARIRRSERLKKKKDIDRLFQNAARLKEGRLRLLYFPYEGKGNVRIGFAVPKKKQKKAHERNRTRRLMRECFRSNKLAFEESLAEKGADADLFLLYQDREVPSEKELRKEMIGLLERFRKAMDTDPLKKGDQR